MNILGVECLKNVKTLLLMFIFVIVFTYTCFLLFQAYKYELNHKNTEQHITP